MHVSVTSPSVPHQESCSYRKAPLSALLLIGIPYSIPQIARSMNTLYAYKKDARGSFLWGDALPPLADPSTYTVVTDSAQRSEGDFDMAAYMANLKATTLGSVSDTWNVSQGRRYWAVGSTQRNSQLLQLAKERVKGLTFSDALRNVTVSRRVCCMHRCAPPRRLCSQSSCRPCPPGWWYWQTSRRAARVCCML